jgi:hypothetical protein
MAGRRVLIELYPYVGESFPDSLFLSGSLVLWRREALFNSSTLCWE